MMKFLNIITLFILSLTFPGINVCKMDVGDYTTFESINLSKGKLIRNWTTKEKNTYASKVSQKRKFYGWNTYLVNEEVEATFESEILFSFYNTGTTKMDYSKTISYYKSSKTSISCSGGITYKTIGNSKKFKHNLDSSINVKFDYTTSEEQKQTDVLKIEVEPGYKAIVYMTGTARVTNGYAQRYIFWIKSNAGAFEYFTITNQYPRVKKVKI